MSDKNNNTFTLIELLTVLMIMGVMLAVAVSALQHNIPAAKQTAFRENVKQIVDALEVYRSRAYIAGDSCYYPASLQELTGYFTQEPVNPYTGTSMLNSDSALSGIEYVRTENCNNYEIVVVQPQIDGFPIVSSITATVSHNNQAAIFRVTVTSSPSNVVAPQQWLAAVGSTVQLRAVTNTCWTFNEWTGNVAVNDPTSANTSFVMSAHDVSVVAHYTASTTPINVTVTASPSNGGSVSITPTSALTCGDRITLTAVPTTNYRFDAWWHNGAVVSRSPVLNNPTPGTYVAEFKYTMCRTVFDITNGVNALVQLSDGSVWTLSPSGVDGVLTIEKQCGQYSYTISKKNFTSLSGNITVLDTATVVGISNGMTTMLSNRSIRSFITLSNPTTVLAATNKGIYKTTDGEKWVDLNNGLSNTNVWSLAVDPYNPNTIYAGTGG